MNHGDVKEQPRNPLAKVKILLPCKMKKKKTDSHSSAQTNIEFCTRWRQLLTSKLSYPNAHSFYSWFTPTHKTSVRFMPQYHHKGAIWYCLRAMLRYMPTARTCRANRAHPHRITQELHPTVHAEGIVHTRRTRTQHVRKHVCLGRMHCFRVWGVEGAVTKRPVYGVDNHRAQRLRHGIGGGQQEFGPRGAPVPARTRAAPPTNARNVVHWA